MTKKSSAGARERFPSSTGKRRPRVDQTNWRTRMQQSRIKFDDDQKGVYLRHLSKHGLKGRAAKTAGISNQTINNHRDNDPDFSEAFDAAVDTYRDVVANEVGRRGHVGWLEPVYGKSGRVLDYVIDVKGRVLMTDEEGSRRYVDEHEDKEAMRPVLVPASIRKFSDQCLLAEAKRVEPAYRERQTIDLNQAGGGVLVAPADVTPEQWVADLEQENKVASERRAKELAELKLATANQNR